jgi:hypothetical protein
MSHLDTLGADEFGQVSASARRLFERLNPAVGPRSIYDFEVAQDTGLPLGTVRRCMEQLDGEAVTVELYGADYRVTAILGG